MSEQDKHIDDLFRKAKKAPPVVNLSEVKDLLKNPKASPRKVYRKWAYLSLSVFVVTGFLAWYLYTVDFTGETEEQNIISPVVVETGKDNVINTPAAENNMTTVPATISTVEEAEVQKRELVKELKEPIVTAAPAKETRDTVTSPDKPKVQEPADPYVTKESEITIPWFADGESIRMYQKKLFEAGITLQIKDIVYSDKDFKREYITELKADILIGDSLYKSVELKNFKEFRIQWATYNTGEVRIKSVKMLDKNYVSRKL